MNAPLRVLYIHNSADVYGASRSLFRLVQRLDRRRFTPLVVLPERGPLADRLRAAEVEVVVHPRLSVITRAAFGSWRLLGFLLHFPCSVIFLWRLMRRQRVGLAHTNTGVMPSGALAARLAGVPHLWHIRDWFQEFKWAWRPYARYICALSSKVIAVSEAIAGQFPSRDKVIVLHNGFALEEFQAPQAQHRQAFRERFGLGDHFVAGCVGRIKFQRKGQEVLVRAMHLLKQRGRTARCLIVGSPFPGNESHLAALQDLVRELCLEGSVLLTGEVADPRPAYAAMDVLVLPSAQPEPFGGVVMEAMAMRLPVIATAIGGSLDQVAEGVTGFLVPPNDPAALAARLEMLMDDPALRARMGQAGPERIARHFSLDQMMERVERLYEETISLRQPA
jgi:glycosyltransferase involved in cell wall biosynthesis